MLDKEFCVKLIHCGNLNPANEDDSEEKNIFFLPMGLFPLGKVLKDRGFNVEIIHSDLLDDRSVQNIGDWSSIDVVGFDCHWVNQSVAVLETAETIKKINPKVFIFLGGYTASLFCEEIIRDYLQVDAVIRGDGEIPIVSLCNELWAQKGKNINSLALDNIPNLVWRRERCELVKNEFSYIGTEKEMNTLDFAALELLRNWEYYKLSSRFWTRFDPINSTPLFFLETGRGCQYACLYCGGNCEAQKRMNNRNKFVVCSIDAVLETIKKASGYGFCTFYSSFEFTESDKWYIQLFNSIGTQNLELNYVYGSWRLPSRELIDALSCNFNQVLIEISPETANESLRYNNKDARLYYSNKQLENCLDYIETKGNVKVQLYFGYFLSGDTVQTIHETFDYIVKLAVKYCRIAELEYFNFSTDPASLLYLYPEKFDIEIYVSSFKDYIRNIKENYIIKKGQSADLRAFKPKDMSIHNVERIEKKVKVFNFLFSTYRKTLSYGLLKNQSSDLVSDILQEYETRESLGSALDTVKLKNVIIDVFRRQDAVDSNVLKIAEDEFNCQKTRLRTYKATPQIWIDNNIVIPISENKPEGNVDSTLEKDSLGIEFNLLNI